jgi:hypothetical protein
MDHFLPSPYHCCPLPIAFPLTVAAIRWLPLLSTAVLLILNSCRLRSQSLLSLAVLAASRCPSHFSAVRCSSLLSLTVPRFPPLSPAVSRCPVYPLLFISRFPLLSPLQSCFLLVISDTTLYGCALPLYSSLPPIGFTFFAYSSLTLLSITSLTLTAPT